MNKVRIYKIYSDKGDMVYYGSTKKKYLSQRWGEHTSKYYLWKDGKYNNVTSFKLFDKYGLCHCKIALMEEFDYIDDETTKKREAFYISNDKNAVNRCLPGRTNKESAKAYYHKNKESIKEKRDNKKESIDQSSKSIEPPKPILDKIVVSF